MSAILRINFQRHRSKNTLWFFCRSLTKLSLRSNCKCFYVLLLGYRLKLTRFSWTAHYQQQRNYSPFEDHQVFLCDVCLQGFVFLELACETSLQPRREDSQNLASVSGWQPVASSCSCLHWGEEKQVFPSHLAPFHEQPCSFACFLSLKTSFLSLKTSSSRLTLVKRMFSASKLELLGFVLGNSFSTQSLWDVLFSDLFTIVTYIVTNCLNSYLMS